MKFYSAYKKHTEETRIKQNKMQKQIFINLEVENFAKSKDFYLKMGFENYPLFTFDDQICLSWSDQILLMLHQKTETSPNSNCSFTLPVSNSQTVNEIVENCLNLGANEVKNTVIESFMFLRTIEDLDQNEWGICYLDSANFRKIKNR